jgi:hypothetical protein
MESARAPPDFKQVVETHKQETIAAGFSATIQSERGGYRPAKPRKLKALEEHFGRWKICWIMNFVSERDSFHTFSRADPDTRSTLREIELKASDCGPFQSSAEQTP